MVELLSIKVAIGRDKRGRIIHNVERTCDHDAMRQLSQSDIDCIVDRIAEQLYAEADDIDQTVAGMGVGT